VAIGSASLDVNGIVNQLMSLEQRPVAALNKKEGDYQAKISAYGSVSGALSTFQTSVQELGKQEKFQSLKATSSDLTAFTATAAAKAEPGSHSISITSLAQMQKLAAAGQTSDTANIGNGDPTKLTFDFGSIKGGTLDPATGKYAGANFMSNGQGSKTLTIDASNNTLLGIRDAINAAKIGVNASVINDGTDTPYALTLSATNMGANNSLKISAKGDEVISALLAHDPTGIQNLSQTVAAQNAVLTIDGVVVNKASNTISEVIPGVSFELLKATTSPASLSIARDSSAVTNLIQNFVKNFNDLNKTFQDLTAYNAATKQGAVLQGDATLRLLQSQIRAVLNTPVSNTGGALTNLSQIGLSFQKDGTMALDTSKFNAAITKYPNDVASLFATVGNSSDSLLSYANSASNTGTYPVNISQHATRGSLGSCEEIESLIIEEGENDALNVSVNGVSAAITLAAGTYSEDSLATEIQAKINGASTLSSAGLAVSVVHDRYGYLVTSNTYGAKSSVEISGTGALNIFGKSPINTPGKDVVGTINGSPATGAGQTLSADAGAALGLKVQVLGGALGERGKVSYSQGYAHTLNTLITAVLAKDGQIESRKKGINNSIKDITSHRDTIQQRLPLQEARFRKQYSTLETSLSNMSKTSNYLNQQLSNLPRPY